MESNDQDLIRRCVGYAEGWEAEYEDHHDYWFLAKAEGGYWHQDGSDIELTALPQIFLDALAAQLVRQVDKHHDMTIDRDIAVIRAALIDGGNTLAVARGPDRTLNTLRAIDEFCRGQEDD